ncbi:MAG: hypothetical protein WC565_03810 [Parcubacteria group bacterium]
MATKKKFEARLAQCKKLKVQFSEAGIDFLLSLVEFEADEASWRSGVGGAYGWATFTEVLHVINTLLVVKRFERFKSALKIMGIDTIRKIGVDAAEKVATIPPDAKSKHVRGKAIPAVIAELIEFRNRNGTGASSRTADSVIRKHYVSKPPVNSKKENAFDELKTENKMLRAENKRLKARVVALETENAGLRERLGDGNATVTPRKSRK